MLASFALLVSVFFLLKELRLTRDSIRHSDFVNSINRSAENMLRITENEGLLRTIEKINVYRNHPCRNHQQLRHIIDGLSSQERVRYFHFQRNACLSCEVFLKAPTQALLMRNASPWPSVGIILTSKSGRLWTSISARVPGIILPNCRNPSCPYTSFLPVNQRRHRNKPLTCD